LIEVLLIVIALALVVACGAFVAAEFAFVTVDRSSVERAAESGDRAARGVQSALRTLSTQLSSAQVGITLTNLLIGFLAEPSIADLVDGPLLSAGVPEGAVAGVSLAIALVLATSVTMIFGELVPKNLAIARPLETARAVQGFLRGFTRAAGWIVRFFNGTANALLRRIGIEPQEELASARSPEELVSLVRRSADQGTLEPGTAALLQRSLAFGERRAHEIMTPRGRVATVGEDDPVAAVIALARSSGRSRFPVLGADGAFTGIVHIKKAVGVPFEQRDLAAVSEVMDPPVLVPASVELDDLLDTLRAGGLQMALVVDEFGNVDGIVTLEDLVEEIVGEVRDEHDEGEEPARREPDGTWTLPGLMRPDEIRDLNGIRLPEDDDYETVAGLIGDRLARMPATGDTVVLRAPDEHGAQHEVELTVLSMDDLRVDRIRLALRPATSESDHG
jgi:CBS domain containing-hemolysin-like protein